MSIINLWFIKRIGMIKLISLMIEILLSNVPFNSFDINKDKNIIEEYSFNIT